ncbi:porin family protein [Lutibacter citreus]|uniref:porin family protein n=1 Tax=Lutibacter citreus TaxID=2138210 RepID=UPI000DBE6F77|nr:porin family protein [Lutibacter citreus]
MKKRSLLFTLIFLTSIVFVNAQNGFGIKAGLNYNSNGELKDASSEIGNIIENKGERKSGYNVGVFGKINLGAIYLRPELVYTKTTSQYKLNSENTEDYKISKIDVPVLVGLKVIGPLHVFAGPAFQYILKNDLKGIDIKDVENEYSVGINIGASLEFGRFGIDARYERGLNENEADFSKADKTFKLDSRPDQLIFSLSYSLTKKKE